MSSTTPNFNLKKDSGSDPILQTISDLSANMDIVDSEIQNRKTDLTTHKTATVLDHPDGSVVTAKLADKGVTTVKLADWAVTLPKIDPTLLTNVAGNQNNVFAPNSYSWVATANQQTFTLPANTMYTVGFIWVNVGGIDQTKDAFTATDGVSFTVAEPLTAGTKVDARWFQGQLSSQAHHTTHYANGADAIDVTQLQNYQSAIADQIGNWSSSLNSRGINVLYPPAPYVAAKGDGSDDTTAITNMYNSFGTRGGTLFFPPNDFNFNLTIAKPNVNIVGCGRSATTSQGGVGGTRFLPYDLTKPVLQIGDGLNVVNTVTLKGFSLVGDQSTTTSDGLVIYGAYYINVDDIYVEKFGGDNIRITSSSTQKSFNINFSNFFSKWANGSCFKIIYGSGYVTGVNLQNFLISGNSTTGATAVYLDSAVLNVVNGWIQTYNGVGHVYMTGSNVYLIGTTTTIDSANSTDVLLQVNTSPTIVSNYLKGYITMDGVCQWNDSSKTTIAYTGSNLLPYHTRLNYAHITNNLLFGQSDGSGAIPEIVNDNGPSIWRKGVNPNEYLGFTSTAIRPIMSYQYPLQIQSQGSIWKNATTGQLRYRYNSWWPGSDVDGVPFTTFQSVPATATSAGNAGDIASDGSYLYLCTALNTWKRVAISAW